MREVKFRAWDKVEQEMREVGTINFDSDQYDVRLLKPTENAPNHWCLRNFDQIELMQYTGLKDKNGVGIYEGDVIKDRNGTRYKIVFIEGMFVASNGTEKSVWDCFKIHWISENLTTEIIGNIHQNPELL